ncbi:hypothetical protein JCGZ_25361 [Jatropha curcas]|uniref:Uncharacterized protein n=1 Tax=Jatropha curcas TaxID=180498 RepID=A0A067JMC4_JATCU|nr:hypothetical protein JCGZ_25361 [Jatropha curcas]
MRVNSSRIHYPKALEDEKSWLLFHKVAFSPHDDICKDENIIEVGKKIVKKCGGLPLAIKTIAALLKSKRQLKEWEKVHDEFQKLTQEKVPVMASLQLSYDALPRHLKQLLLSFSIYPEDFEIRAEQLVHWWVGEGLIKSRNSKTAMDLGNEYLADLAGRCLVEVVRRRGYDGKVHSCKMHDLVRDLTIKIAGEEELCSFESGGKQRQLIMQDSRWLGITDENISISSLSQCSKLRAILLMSSLSISSNMPISLSSLRVLDLSNGKLDDKSVENLFKWIILLKRLAHLNLSGAPGLKNVPRIRKLRNLQLLVLSGCRIGRLTKLEELSGFKLHRRENSQSCGLLELQNLVQLRVLRIKLSDESEILDNEWEALSRLEKLQVLAIDTENTKEPTNLQKLDRLKPPPGLEQVYLRHYRRNHLPEWINPKTLSKLQYLSIEFGDIKHICPNLELREEKWKLVGLCLKFLPLFEDDWKKLKQIMPSLCDVEVSNCPSLKNPPYEDKSWTSRN